MILTLGAIRTTGLMRPLFWLAAALAFAMPASAQVLPGDEAGRPSLAGTLRIRSEPPGALVTLEGEHIWKGSTPWDLSRGLRGNYRVMAEMTGYERWQRTVRLIEGESRQLDIRLVRKTAWKAGVRSLLVPGWGQFYAERPAKGTLFLVGAAAAAAGLIVTHEVYQNDVDEFREARDAYQEARTVEEIERLRPRFEQRRRDADRSYDRRQALLYTVGAIHAAALLDAFLLFPGPAQGGFASIALWGDQGPRCVLEPSLEGGVALSLTWPGREDRRP